MKSNRKPLAMRPLVSSAGSHISQFTHCETQQPEANRDLKNVAHKKQERRHDLADVAVSAQQPQ